MKDQQHNDHILAVAFNRASVGLAVINEQGFFIEVNEMFCSMLGYSQVELEQKPFSIIFPSEVKHEISAFQHSFFESGQICYKKEWQVKTKNGTLIDLLFTGDLFVNENGERFLIQTARDVSAEKYNKQGIELSQLQYQSIIDNSLLAFFLTKPDGSILEANKAAEKIFGYSVEELCRLGRKVIIDDTDPRLAEKLKERQEKGFSVGEITGIRKNGERFPLEFSSFVFSERNGELRTSTMLYDISERKRQQRELQKSQEEMASILNNTEEMFMIIDNEYRIINYNKATKERANSILGKDLNIGDSLLSLATPERYAFIIPVYNKVLNGETIRYKHTVDRGRGTEIYQLTYSPVFDGDGVCNRFMVTVRDITVEENALSEIIRNQQLLQQAESIAHVGSWELDLVTNKLYWSDEVFRMCGYEPKAFEVTFERGLGVIHPDDQATSIEEMQRAIADKRNYTAEKRFVRPDGSIRFIESKAKVTIDSDGNAVRLVGVFHDITEQKLMQRELAISQQEYKSLFEQNPDAVLSFDLTGKFISVNDAAMLLAETSREKLLNETFDSLIDAGEIETARNYFRDVRNGNPQRFQSVIVTARGNRKTLAVSLMPIVVAGEITGVFGILKDITDSKNAALALKVNEEQLNLIYNSTAGIIFLLGVENNGEFFRFISMNNAGLTTIGLKQEDLFNKPVQEVIPEPSLSLVLSKYKEAVQSGKQVVWQEETAYPSGTKTGIVTVTPIYDTNGNCIRLVGSVNDITDLKKIEKSLAISRQEYKSLFDQNPDAVYSLDLQGRFTSFNLSLEKLLECSRAEIIHAGTFVPFCHPADLEKTMGHFLKVQQGEAQTYEVRAITFKGHQKHLFITNMPIVVDGEITGVYGIAKDVTSEQLALAQLELSNERYEYATKATNDVIWDWDLKTDKVVRAGSGFYIMFGYNEKDANNDDSFWMKKVHPDDLEQVIQKRQLVFSDSKQDFWEDEYRFLRRNGEFAFIYDRGYIFRDKEGKPVRMIGATKDITEHKLSELQLKELYGKLEERASQLQLSNTELERFAYIASHDLQEPLRMVSSFLQLLEKKYQDSIDEKGREYIRFAVDGSLRMKRLINDLLDYSRVTTRKQQLETVNMQLVISDVLQNLSLQVAEKNAVIKTEVLPILPAADKTQMVQLLQNLVGNALKYSGIKQPEIQIEAKEQNDEWLFSVKDNGIGFDEKFADKIFVIFQRLHNKTEYSGTGIGLAICKKIIDRHGGKIYAESVPGEGSTFWFTIKKQLVPEQ